MISIEKMIAADAFKDGREKSYRVKEGELTTSSAINEMIIPEEFNKLKAIEIEVYGSHEFSDYTPGDIVFAFALQCANEALTINGSTAVKNNIFLGECWKRTTTGANTTYMIASSNENGIKCKVDNASYAFPATKYKYRLLYAD